MNNLIECYINQEKEYIDYIEQLEDEIKRLKKANEKLKEELHEMLCSKNDLRKLLRR